MNSVHATGLSRLRFCYIYLYLQKCKYCFALVMVKSYKYCDQFSKVDEGMVGS